MKKYLKIFILLITISLVFYLWNSKHENKNIVIDEIGNIKIDFIFSEDNIYSFEYTPSNSLFAITKNISEEQNWEFNFKEYGEMGILITQINDKINGESSKYWQYSVNNEMPMISADKYHPIDKDYIKWEFKKSKF